MFLTGDVLCLCRVDRVRSLPETHVRQSARTGFFSNFLFPVSHRTRHVSLPSRYTEPPPYQRKVAEACFRFMDSEARFADQELDMLLRGVQDNEK